ncbi:FirrV-1-B30 precursor [Ectocarpus siliculosus]|uniref:FirrV-1-B30 n=1 Tax=Ectocarpus siliculosus TaxID=2880 RepID=D7FRK8_ECTSI|nr:FirrV-1-B30 precursor [Ectocarpus siliculosus]|eukprot:CBJ30799.1 FirrV-1-B30 precursor [Ectocarpus siliculosus]
MIRLLGLGLLAASAKAREIAVAAGEDFEAVCLKVVEPGDSCYLAKGDYYHDGITSTHGTADAPITITGDSAACIKGSNTQDRVLQIAHDYYIVEGICFDGDHDGDNPPNVATAIYVLGADKKSTKNGVTSSVTGFKMIDLEIKNFGSECVHFRYFVTHSEVTGCTIQHCGMEAFEDGGGGKVGEGIYVGTALDQVDDGKAPEVKIRTGSADNVDADECNYNWIHHNTFRTYGNECVDVKEGSAHNLIEHNVCEQQKDPNSGCIGFRGSDNTARFNEIAECLGAGIRVGGDDDFGENNHLYGNAIQSCGNGAFSVMSPNQGVVCENVISDVDAISFGAYDQDQDQFTEAVATGDCSSYPGDIEGVSSTPDSADDDDDGGAEGDALTTDDDLEAGVNFADEAKDSEPEIEVIETNESAGSSGLGDCASVAAVGKTSVQHPDYADGSTSVENLFDSDVDSYYSIHRESTYITLELEDEVDVNGVAIGFFMKAAEEERIQTFDVAVRSADDDDWTTVISRKESSGEMTVQTFPFSSRPALYVRFETHGNSFNNWSAFTELEVCVEAAAESNALFGGLQALDSELEALAGAVCDAPAKLSPVSVHASGQDDVRVVFDGNFDTRWSTTNTQNESDLSNDKVIFTFGGDMMVSTVQISFYDGDLAHQIFSIYTQSASDRSWTPVLLEEHAARDVALQTFTLDMDGVHKLYVVGKGNEVGAYSKFSEIEVHGC